MANDTNAEEISADGRHCLPQVYHHVIRTEDLAIANYNSLRNELLAAGVVENTAISDAPITGNMSADASLTRREKIRR